MFFSGSYAVDEGRDSLLRERGGGDHVSNGEQNFKLDHGIDNDWWMSGNDRQGERK